MLESVIFQGQKAQRWQAPCGSAAIVLEQGAHLVSWCVPDSQGRLIEQLYLSPQAVFAPGQAVRGGVPVIFPQFECRELPRTNPENPQPVLPRHGMARTAQWRFVRSQCARGLTSVVWAWSGDEASHRLWPHAFELMLTLTIGRDSSLNERDGERACEQLQMDLQVTHTGAKDAAGADAPLIFMAALHTYLRVADSHAIEIEGLRDLSYWDSVRQQQGQQDEQVLRITGELDRIYSDVNQSIDLVGACAQSDQMTPTMRIAQSGFQDAVIWNPGAHKAAALADMPSDDHSRMVCIEAAQIHRPVVLQPEQTWRGSQLIQCLSTLPKG